MMKQLKTDVNGLVLDEYARASEQYGPKHHSLHEAAAVMYEEYEEAQEEIAKVDKLFDEFWSYTRNDSGLGCKQTASRLRDRAINAACELLQLAAMAHKTVKSIPDKGFLGEEIE